MNLHREANMAKKVYHVVQAVSSPTKDGKGVFHLTRDNAALIPDMLSSARIQEFVEAGILTESNADGTPSGAEAEPAIEGFVTAEPAPAARKGAKKE